MIAKPAPMLDDCFHARRADPWSRDRLGPRASRRLWQPSAAARAKAAAEHCHRVRAAAASRAADHAAHAGPPIDPGSDSTVASTLDTNPVLFVRADEAMPAGTSLRFVRAATIRAATSQLAQLRTRSDGAHPAAAPRLRAAWCAARSRSRSCAAARRGRGARSSTGGPYELRC